MEIKNLVKERLNQDGWIEIENISTADELITFARRIGEIVPHPNGKLVNNLIPNNGQNSILGTFSNRFGYGRFPFHTDTAFWINPVRYILFGIKEVSCCTTQIALASDIFNRMEIQDRKDIERAIFKVKTVNKQFYSPLIFKDYTTSGIKYDPSCMTPANKFAEKFVKNILEIDYPVTEIKWSGKKALIIDNWKVLHGRGEALVNEERELKRIYIK